MFWRAWVLKWLELPSSQMLNQNAPSRAVSGVLSSCLGELDSYKLFHPAACHEVEQACQGEALPHHLCCMYPASPSHIAFVLVSWQKMENLCRILTCFHSWLVTNMTKCNKVLERTNPCCDNMQCPACVCSAVATAAIYFSMKGDSSEGIVISASSGLRDSLKPLSNTHKGRLMWKVMCALKGRV